jgi:hypothetical protein
MVLVAVLIFASDELTNLASIRTNNMHDFTTDHFISRGTKVLRSEGFRRRRPGGALQPGRAITRRLRGPALKAPQAWRIWSAAP